MLCGTSRSERIAMRLYRILFSSALAAGLIATPALADPPKDAERAFRERVQGRSMPLPRIEQRVMPLMPGADYLGPEFNGRTYRLKFMRQGRVIWIDVDAATGKVKRRSD